MLQAETDGFDEIITQGGCGSRRGSAHPVAVDDVTILDNHHAVDVHRVIGSSLEETFHRLGHSTESASHILFCGWRFFVHHQHTLRLYARRQFCNLLVFNTIKFCVVDKIFFTQKVKNNHNPSLLLLTYCKSIYLGVMVYGDGSKKPSLFLVF